MMQKVRVLVSAFFVLYGCFISLSAFPLRYFFYCAISLSFSITYT
uniref:Lipoprotein n=1 Tax=Anguilla anguilla TaxID=7936 RepID=A0A0E9UKD8_ANGAN